MAVRNFKKANFIAVACALGIGLISPFPGSAENITFCLINYANFQSAIGGQGAGAGVIIGSSKTFSPIGAGTKNTHCTSETGTFPIHFYLTLENVDLFNPYTNISLVDATLNKVTISGTDHSWMEIHCTAPNKISATLFSYATGKLESTTIQTQSIPLSAQATCTEVGS